MKDFSYNSYAKARDASWHVMANYGINSLPVDVFKLAQDMGIKVVPYDKGGTLMKLLGIARLKGKNDGLYVRFLGRSYIFYDDSVSSEGRIRFTIAHEIGHHILSHIKTRFIPRCAERPRGAARNAKEREANVFAARLLAPSIVLHQLNITSAEDIARFCGMSREAAEYRLSRLEKLAQRDMFQTSRLEQKVLENFKDFIKENRL